MSTVYKLMYPLIIVLFSVTTCVLGQGKEKEELPNVLIIMADDLGYSDLGCYGSEIKTPNLDKLASNGLRYTNFYNCARCWSSRASLLYGYYPQQIGRDNAPGILGGGRYIRPKWAGLLPQYLKSSGYRSYHSGKWHIDGMPIENGFDHSYYINDQDRHFNPTEHYEDDKKLQATKANSGFYSTKEITNKALAHLQEHFEDHPDQPFFSYVAYTAPHFPLHALPEDIKKVRERYTKGWDQLRKERWKQIKKLA